MKTPLFYKADRLFHTIMMPLPGSISSDTNYAKIHRDFERIQWFSVGHGGAEHKEKNALVFTFDEQEFDCVLRYLQKFSWKPLDTSSTIKDFPLEPETEDIPRAAKK